MTVTARHVINTPNGDVMRLTDNCGQPSCLYQQVSFPDSLVKTARMLVKALTDGCDGSRRIHVIPVNTVYAEVPIYTHVSHCV